ncbi:pantoate--beta-alanine ligase [Microlunatus elymi]|uniref:pantoate--beta-alanine ligase n=1 Tax=Microlunatus elymi TaxID=2596828 RepID=UPI00224A9814|nr:pantoate--beta-alanine ligase [Microlunatus elymi]
MAREVGELRRMLAPARQRSATIALVPTMGALHEGHLSLIRSAAASADEVVVSIFVNPAQFNDPADLLQYPRDVHRDIELASAAGASLIFVPDPDEVYPVGFSTSVHIGGVAALWEGVARGPSHFDGVALVVTKLFGMVGPDVAWFGQKDAQQVAVVRRLVADLNLPVEIRTGPTVREPDGLAMSSRNVRLSSADRDRAAVLHRALDFVKHGIMIRENDSDTAIAAGTDLLRTAGIEAEYLAVVDPDTFEPRPRLDDRPALVIIAARVGPVRLIDNEPVA